MNPLFSAGKCNFGSLEAIFWDERDSDLGENFTLDEACFQSKIGHSDQDIMRNEKIKILPY